MDIKDILEHNRQINVKRLEDKEIAREIIIALSKCTFILFSWKYLQDNGINGIKNYSNIYFNPELLQENYNETIKANEYLVNWTKDNYLEIFENLDNRYILEGFEFYISNFDSLEDVINDINKKEDNIKFANRPEKVLRHFRIILCNNKHNNFDKNFVNLTNITQKFFNKATNDSLKNTDKITVITDELPNSYIIALKGFTLEDIINKANDDNIIENKYYSSVEELNASIDNITDKFNELILDYINLMPEGSEIINATETTIKSYIEKFKNEEIYNVYILTNNDMYNSELTNIPKILEIPEENIIYSEKDKNKIINMILNEQ